MVRPDIGRRGSVRLLPTERVPKEAVLPECGRAGAFPPLHLRLSPGFRHGMGPQLGPTSLICIRRSNRQREHGLKYTQHPRQNGGPAATTGEGEITRRPARSPGEQGMAEFPDPPEETRQISPGSYSAPTRRAGRGVALFRSITDDYTSGGPWEAAIRRIPSSGFLGRS